MRTRFTLSPHAHAIGAALAGALVLSTSIARADEDDGPSGRDLVVASNTGFQWGIAPGIFLPTGGGDVGFSLAVHAGYGVEAGPVIVVPGGAVHAFFPTGGSIITTFAEGKLIYPIGGFAPYLIGGAGPGFITSTGGGTYAALKGGGGAMYHFSYRFALGAEATYQTLLSTNFSVLSIGPSILIGF